MSARYRLLKSLAREMGFPSCCVARYRDDDLYWLGEDLDRWRRFIRSEYRRWANGAGIELPPRHKPLAPPLRPLK